MKENNPQKLVREILPEDSSANRLHLATIRIQGHYQLEAAKINSRAVIQSAKIGAYARYFHGSATLLGAFGVFGGFAYRIYEDNKKICKEAEKLRIEMNRQDSMLKELAESYDKLAEEYSSVDKNVEAKDSYEKSEGITRKGKI